MKGAITKRMTAIEEMAGMDVLCSDKTGTLTLNRLTVDRNLIEVEQLGFIQDRTGFRMVSFCGKALMGEHNLCFNNSGRFST